MIRAPFRIAPLGPANAYPTLKVLVVGCAVVSVLAFLSLAIVFLLCPLVDIYYYSVFHVKHKCFFCGFVLCAASYSSRVRMDARACLYRAALLSSRAWMPAAFFGQLELAVFDQVGFHLVLQAIVRSRGR